MPEPTTETDALVKALTTVAGNLPIAALELREGRMAPERQHALSTLLIELGELVHQHVDLDVPAGHADGGAVPPR